MRTRLVTLLVVIVVVTVGWRESLSGAKPVPPPPNWLCQVVLRDAPGDTIKSDTPTGSAPRAYVNGVDSVNCNVLQAVGAVHYNWLYLQIPSTSARSMVFQGQTQVQSDGSTASYNTFTNRAPGTFEVKGFANAAWTGVAYTDVEPFRALLASAQFAGSVGQFAGDSNFTAGAGALGTSSVFVQPLDACSWRITSYTTEDTSAFSLTSGENVGTITSPSRIMKLTEVGAHGSQPAPVRGYFRMPFGATVTVIANKGGCPAQ